MRVKKKHKRNAHMTSGPGDKQNLFAAQDGESSRSSNACYIIAVGKRRDGGTRYWCLAHKADATAKYGRPAAGCRASHIPPIKSKDTLLLDVDQYMGGIALWGAVPPIYDTTQQPLDRGIHVHARSMAVSAKTIDRTFRAVRLIGSQLPKGGVVISELDAIYYMVSSVFGYELKHIACSYCGDSHLDKDWFSVHPHRRHLCAGCGKHFRGSDTAIGNPICRIRDAWSGISRKPRPAKKKLDIRQADYPGGIQIWGSNPAIIWTRRQREEEGIHVHAFRRNDSKAMPDDTFSLVTIDGVRLDPLMVRTLMAQSALPHIESRVVAMSCPACGQPKLSIGAHAFTPAARHDCARCGRQFRGSSRFHKTIGNPLIAILDRLATYAARPPQKHAIGLLPETL